MQCKLCGRKAIQRDDFTCLGNNFRLFVNRFTTFPVSARYKICLAAIFNNPILDKAFQKNKTLLIFYRKSSALKIVNKYLNFTSQLYCPFLKLGAFPFNNVSQRRLKQPDALNVFLVNTHFVIFSTKLFLKVLEFLNLNLRDSDPPFVFLISCDQIL